MQRRRCESSTAQKALHVKIPPSRRPQSDGVAAYVAGVRSVLRGSEIALGDDLAVAGAVAPDQLPEISGADDVQFCPKLRYPFHQSGVGLNLSERRRELVDNRLGHIGWREIAEPDRTGHFRPAKLRHRRHVR